MKRKRTSPAEAESGRGSSCGVVWAEQARMADPRPRASPPPHARANYARGSPSTCSPVLCSARLKPSADCGPFRGLPFFIHSIYSWIDTLSTRPSYLWVVWIYQNLIGSVHFFFILTLIVL